MILMVAATLLSTLVVGKDDCNPSLREYGSILEVVHVLNACYHYPSRIQDVEFIATIFEGNGAYQVRIAEGRRQTGKATIQIVRRKSQTLVALWHTHGRSSGDNEYFSPGDVETVNELGVPFYLYSPKRSLRVYAPGMPVANNHVRRVGPSSFKLPKGVAWGEEVVEE